MYEKNISYDTNLKAPILNLTMYTQALMEGLTEIKKP